MNYFIEHEDLGISSPIFKGTPTHLSGHVCETTVWGVVTFNQSCSSALNHFYQTTDISVQGNHYDHNTLFDLNFSLAVCYVILVVILSVLGVGGNLFIIYVMRKEKRMNKDARAFVTNLAVADLLVSGIANPMCVAGAFLGMNYLHGKVWLCIAVASLCFTACICAFLNVVCLTVNRWIFICHDKLYDRFFNNTKTTIFCILAWVAGFGAELPNFLGWGGHYFDEKSHQCIWDRTASRGFTLFVILGLITTPLVLLVYCNTAVLTKIWKTKRDVLNFSTVGLKSTLMASISSAKILITMLVVFVVCWIPYVIVHLVDTEDTYSLEVYLFTTLLAHSHSSWACLIYLSFKKKFRDDLKGLFKSRNRIHPSSVLTVTQNCTDKPMVKPEIGNGCFRGNPYRRTTTKNNTMSTLHDYENQSPEYSSHHI